MHLLDWFGHPWRYRLLMGDDGYRSVVSELLGSATLDDCAAAGLEVDGRQASFVTAEAEVKVIFSPDLSHRVVLWFEPSTEPGLAWVDGRAVTVDAEPARVTIPCHWAGDRFVGMAVPAPVSHPLQRRVGMAASFTVFGLLIWDTVGSRVHSLELPHDHERWQRPLLIQAGRELRILGTPPPVATASDWLSVAPDRVLVVDD